jgi:polysaccharide export outer membrane protein
LPLLAAGLVGLSEPQAAMAQNRQPAATRSQEEDGYLLGGGDRVKIDFFNVPEYSGEYSGSHLGEV